MSRAGDGDAGFVLPAGTVTLLLADVKGSVSLWESDRDAMTTAVAVLDSLVDERVGLHGGVRPVEQGEGDSFVCAFSRASDALACALDLQLATVKQPWPGELTVRLRMGIHTGEVQLRDEGNYIGAAVNRCARMRDIGDGGQTLVSRAAHDLMIDHLPESAALEHLGTYRLRDLARAEDVYQLRHPELPTDFPALRSLDVLPNNLPVQLTTFIGRDREIATVGDLVSEHRVVTLTGSGGCGKTRLAMQVAADLLDHRPDGVWWVDLAPISDPALVPAAVAGALSVKEIPGHSVAVSLHKHLREQHAQLVLDNCEHVVSEAAGFVDALLHACPAVGVLATSREPLGVEGEIPWRVPSLSLPAEHDPPALESLSQCEAVRLFIERARRVRPNFAVTNDNAPAVAGICQRLDGIPLAIELAAARTRMMTPEQVLAGLDDRFHLLAGGARTAVARQQTLRASVDWSFDLLSDEERTLVARMSVFAGSFDLGAAEEVCSGEGLGKLHILELLSQLVDRSLVQVEEARTQARYRLLETIRQYGAEKLAGSAERDDVRNRHLTYYAALASTAEAELEGPGQMEWLARLDVDHDNLRSAVDWSISSGRLDEGQRICAGIWMFWFVRGHLTEGHARIEAVAAAGHTDPQLRARTFVGATQLGLYRGDAQAVEPLATEALEIGRDLGDDTIVGRALETLGWTVAFLGRPEASALFEEAIPLCRAAGDTWYLTDALNGLGSLAVLGGGAIEDARHGLVEAVAISRANGNRIGQETALALLGWLRAAQGELDDADSDLRESVVIARDLQDTYIASIALAFLAYVAGRRGALDDAGALCEEAVAFGQETSPLALATALVFRGLLAYARNDFDTATAEMQEAHELNREMEIPFVAAWAQRVLTDIARARGDLVQAQTLVEDGLTLARPVGGWGLGFVLEGAARVQRIRGPIERAEALHHEALRTLMESGYRLAAVETLESLASLAVAQGNLVEAARLFAAAAAAHESFGSVRWLCEQPAYDADLARLREGLDGEAFSKAWDEGYAMTLEEAAAYAARGRGERGRPSMGWASLTPTEVRVTDLVAQGLSNPQIAERLFVSRRTVTTHLSHIYAKLGMSSRHQLTVERNRETAGS